MNGTDVVVILDTIRLELRYTEEKNMPSESGKLSVRIIIIINYYCQRFKPKFN